MKEKQQLLPSLSRIRQRPIPTDMIPTILNPGGRGVLALKNGKAIPEKPLITSFQFAEVLKKLQSEGIIFMAGKEITLLNPLQIIQRISS